MSRVLVTGGAGMIGAALVRRLLRDPEYEVRVADRRATPQWMREGCEIHSGDLRSPAEAKAAIAGASHVIHLAESAGGILPDREQQRLPDSLLEVDSMLCSALIRGALELDVECFVYVSSATVFQDASEFPTSESQLTHCPAPPSAYGFSKLAGEVRCRAAGDEHGLRYTICRPFDVYGPAAEPSQLRISESEDSAAAGSAREGDPTAEHSTVLDLIIQSLAGRQPLQIRGSGEQTRTPTHVTDVAEGIISAMGAAAGLGEDFNIATPRELTLATIAAIVWETCGNDPAELELEHVPAGPADVARRWPSVEKARKLLGWEAQIEPRAGIAATVEWVREHGSIGSWA
jgi:UDP-glucose 4-epimerase